MNRIIIVASNIGSQGGKNLLFSLIKNFPSNIELLILADSRLKQDLKKYQIDIKYFKNTFFSRFLAELWLSFNSKNTDLVFLLSGLPPILSNKSKNYLYIQNLNNIIASSLKKYSTKIAFRIHIERIWLRIFYRNVQAILVQTTSVKNALLSSGIDKRRIYVAPFSPFNNSIHIVNSNKLINFQKINQFRFIYPASSEPHKNHLNLLKAWNLLALNNIFPTLYLTLDNIIFINLMHENLDIKIISAVKIVNLGVLEYEKLLNFYNLCDSLIFPSLYESLGLPLLEATSLNMPIIASELNYVRDICRPSETFDPNSAQSIVRAVKRFMGVDDFEINIKSPSEFIEFLLHDLTS